MKIENIFEEWKKDSEIDKTELAEEALKVPKLHHKYYMMYTAERIILRSLKEEYKKLKLEKYEFYSDGPTEESKSKGWILPAKGRILKTDIPMYLDGDKDIINLSTRIGIQEEKIEVLDSIIKSISNRSFLLNTALQWYQFSNGGR